VVENLPARQTNTGAHPSDLMRRIDGWRFGRLRPNI